MRSAVDFLQALAKLLDVETHDSVIDVRVGGVVVKGVNGFLSFDNVNTETLPCIVRCGVL